MKKPALLLGLMVCYWPFFAQVGIGTLTPSSKSVLELSSHTKGFLPPRMTGAERNMLTLTADDIGMTVFQTDLSSPPYAASPKGFYTFDGTTWTPPMSNGSINGETLKWDGSKWVTSSYLFNTGSAIGIGTTAPKCQLQINSGQAATTCLQITNPTTGALTNDGLLLGVNLGTGDARLIQQENKPLYFGTNLIERMRIDSAGNVGINKTHPTSTLDVNGNVKVNSLDVSGAANVASLNATGTVKIGATGTSITGIIRYAGMIDIPVMLSNAEWTYNVTIPNVVTTGTVQISPSESLSQVMIEYARVSAPGMVEIKFVNMSILPNDPVGIMYYITVIQ